MRSISILCVFSCFIFMAITCTTDQVNSSSKTMFQELSTSKTNVKFSNTIKEDINFHHLNWESVYNGAGVAAADFDNDGLDDLFFTGNQVDDAIYQNKGDMVFEDKTKTAGILNSQGWSTGVSVADVNNDGLLDIYVSRMWFAKDKDLGDECRNVLYINKGGFLFEESAKKYGLDDAGHGTQASFFDFDRDGDLDVYILNAPSNNYDQKLEYIKANSIPYVHSDKLYRNDGGKFVDITKESGVEEYGFGLGITTVDLNKDGWTDVYVANDFEIADRMLINQKDGTFVDQVQRKLKHISFSSMGTDAADINNDGEVDIAVLDMQSADHYRSKTNMPRMDEKRFWTGVARGQHYQYMSNMLQLNNGYGFFSEIAQLAGIASTDWSWSVLLADFDLDSRRDIYITNGLNKDIRNNDFAEEMKRFRNKGAQSLFDFSQKVASQKISNLAFTSDNGALHYDQKSEEWGLDKPGFSYGAAYSDLDNDGDLDLVVNNNNAPASIYENSIDSKDYYRLTVNSGPIVEENAKIYVYSNNETFYHEQSRIRGFQSSVNPSFHMGITGKIDSILIVDTKGRTARYSDFTINKHHKVDVTDLEWNGTYTNAFPEKTWIREITGKSDLKWRHSENQFNDFKRESLLPHMQSKNGPWVAKAEVKKGNLLYFGNGHGAKASMYKEQNGLFTKIKGPWVNDGAAEDQGADFGDVDGDGDLDLYVSSGGAEFPVGEAVYQDRLYINEGNTWKKSIMLPANTFNSSVVKFADFDNDGDQDIFVGGHTNAGQYPTPSPSQLLINDGNKYRDKTIEVANTLRKVGLVNDAIWTDFNNDSLLDLLVVGEFMKPRFYENNGRQLIDKTETYLSEDISGWWFAAHAADLDGDGIDEYILGNIGQNNKYHPNQEHPLKIYGNDFDKNNTNDIVLTKTTDKYGEVPVRGRECSSEQMPFIKSRFKDFDGYAKASVIDIYGEKGLKEGISAEAREFSSGYLKREGGKYVFYRFPDGAQISAIRGIETADVNGDGRMDIMCVGNLYDTEVETTRHDSSIGIVLIQGTNGEFQLESVKKSGFYTPGNTRKIVKLKSGNETMFIVSNNGYVAQSFYLNQ